MRMQREEGPLEIRFLQDMTASKVLRGRLYGSQLSRLNYREERTAPETCMGLDICLDL